ncbi:alpha/beta hydrolase [Streptomyces acidiscabies]|uniref:Alpha/beta fold hydrolase n=1 Tax=Streptomyces acidiscabies TaxID=42234 RepID=A0AAP6BBF6_9ACTN|nr:alpha/beta fold hydrolase [Streptomyces acidiscabies]MBP5938130.1 alpha/beta hydrolase [Streptomyces sp. LBUM 1476]MBZ3909140.1 alpha/beta fold hydrolase [Streptomyces acidiscabies]MDX2961679.1 alpha/beta fold hydrolase [Streptomyces acidiscabies]MDX3016452.1 alpha/beta fold hydrolase [Streptomyces acidiscabies]MDX3788642.1 alpha/beta fold hydrolase [Streptomyces acidiscabies]
MSDSPAGHVARSTVRPNGETARRVPIRTFLPTADGVVIDSVYDPPLAVYETSALEGEENDTFDQPRDHLVFVIAHGFTGAADRPHVRRVVTALRRYGAVVTFSFRGHGASGGRSTVGDREVLDLAAAVDWAHGLGHARVVTVGFSMGGSVVIRHAALHPGDADAVVSVSAPARWYYRGTAPMRRLHWLVTRPSGRLVGRYGFGTRIHHQEWNPVPLSPVEAAAQLAPTPLLVVHGDADGYFPLDHPRSLAEAAPGHAELWLEPGMGHAEHAASEALLARIAHWGVSRAG